MSYPFDLAIAEHDERKRAVFENLNGRLIYNEQLGLYTSGTTLTATEVEHFAHHMGHKQLVDLPLQVADGVAPQDVVAGYIADALLFGERIGRKRTELGE